MKTLSIEKCLDVIPNKFELSLMAMNRAKDLMLGAQPVVEKKTAEKNSYIALREIEDNLLPIDELREKVKNNIKNSDLFLKNIPVNDVDEQQDAQLNEDDLNLDDGDEDIVDGDIELDEEDDFNLDDVEIDDDGTDDE